MRICPVNYVEIWDALRCRRIRTMEGHHRLRVWSLSVELICSVLWSQISQVCGLKWSYDNRELASGGNDNKLLVWNQHSTQPVLRYCEHTAAVKAIAWSPHLHC
ncbi:Protein FIZZY-RELATED 2 [Raphanus sativus]|nr:Protein FIZZY-RELATED 2 [Raphanus sativus]